MNILKLVPRQKPSVKHLLSSIPQAAIYNLLDGWGCSPVVKGDKIIAKCPNHIYHTGHHSTHDDKFTVFESGYTNCFTGAHKDNILNIAAEMWHCDLDTAFNRITSGVGIMPEFGHVVITQDREKEQRELEKKKQDWLRWLNREIGHRFLTDECKEYFAKDGIDEDALDFFDITNTNSDYWGFRGRAIIPFRNSQRELCGFIAVNYKSKEWQVENMANYAYNHSKLNGDNKTLDEWFAIAQEKYKKVLYMPGFTSRDHLFGRYEAMGNFTTWDELMIVEGERDCIKMIQEGIPCVAVHGTTIKQEQLAMLQAMKPEKLYLGFDMDTAGREGCRKAYEQLKPLTTDIRTLEFPDGKDPKKFSGQEMRAIINKGGEKM